MAKDKLYQENLRPQFHFTAQKNWLNDPNGLVVLDGEYHMFFQHNPESTAWGNMTWGHAVSPDMVRWTQLDHAIYPDKLGTIFSGSAVVDHDNTAGFQKGKTRTIVCIYTYAGGCVSPNVPYTQGIAYSNDHGRTFKKYVKNPVLGHVVGGNRDPKVFWHKPTKKWIMTLFLDRNCYGLYGSPDLKKWKMLSCVAMTKANECPDMFELAVDGNPKNTKWLFWGGSGFYKLGKFDGSGFEPETDSLQSNWGGNCYAAQSWSDVPAKDGRRLQIAWMAGGKYPDMPFNQQMSFPVELSLKTTPEGIRLYRKPVKEIENIHGKKRSWKNCMLKPGENLLSGLSGDLFEIRAKINPGKAKKLGFVLRGEKVSYDVAGRTVSCLGHTAPLATEKGFIKLQILLDRTSMEVFGNDGLISMPTCFLPAPGNKSLKIFASGGNAKIASLEVYELKSAW